MSNTGALYTEEQVAEHNTDNDCWLIIGDSKTGGPKVYDVTKYLEDHPGGPEIMLEFAGKNANDMFEDIGHSNEARTTMKKYLVGSLKEDPSKPKSVTEKNKPKVPSSGGLNPLAVVVLLVAIGLGVAYTYFKG